MNARQRVQDIDVHVGQQVRILRNEAGLTQHQLGAAVGVTMQQVAKYEKGRNRMSAARLYQIAKVLGVVPADLFPPLEAVPHTNPCHTEVMEIAKTLSPSDLHTLNAKVLGMLAAEGGR